MHYDPDVESFEAVIREVRAGLALDKDPKMLPATQKEIDEVTSYFEGQAHDLKVEFIQKVYTETILGHSHDVWDVHTGEDRWWVITNPATL